jgi:hypothetical protein
MTDNAIASAELMSDKERDILMQFLGLELFLSKDQCTTEADLTEGNV